MRRVRGFTTGAFTHDSTQQLVTLVLKKASGSITETRKALSDFASKIVSFEMEMQARRCIYTLTSFGLRSKNAVVGEKSQYNRRGIVVPLPTSAVRTFCLVFAKAKKKCIKRPVKILY